MRLSSLSVLCVSVVAVACAKPADKVADSSAGTVAAADSAAMGNTMGASAKTVALSDVAGTWHVVARPADGKDTTATMATMTATADTTGWTMTMGKAKPVPLHVSVSGDSIMSTSDVYPSVRRKGVMVHTTSAYHMQGGKLAGTTVAHYHVKTADSVLTLHSEATKAP